MDSSSDDETQAVLTPGPRQVVKQDDSVPAVREWVFIVNNKSTSQRAAVVWATNCLLCAVRLLILYRL